MTHPTFLAILKVLGHLAGSIPPVKPFGYLDPGSGSYLLQLLLAALLGGIFVMRHSWRRVLAFLRKLFRRHKDAPLDEQ